MESNGDGRALLDAALDTLPINIAVLDTDGTIRTTTCAWRDVAAASALKPAPEGDGAYLAALDDADTAYASRAADGLRAVLGGEREQFELAYPCQATDEQRWFRLRAAPFTRAGERYVTVAHTEITARKARDQALRDAYEISARTDWSFDQQVDALLELVRDVVGTQFGTLSRVHDDAGEYVFEAVTAPPNVDLAAGETTPLETLPNCRQVVETAETLVLRDVEAEAPDLADPEWGIASYLGAPVVVDGEVYGTFCFYSMTPRDEAFSDWAVTFVDLLSNWVSYELERQHRERRLQQLRENVTDVVWMSSPQKDEMEFVSDAYADVWGRRPDTLYENPTAFVDAIHPDDRERVRDALAAQRNAPDAYEETYRVVQPDGEVRWVHDQAAGVYADDGTLECIVGVATDITERKQREQKYRQLTERISDAYYAFDSDWTVTYWNDAIADRQGVPADEIVGTNFWEAYPEVQGTVYEATLREAMQSQEQQSCEFYYEPGDYWIELHAYPDDEGISVISTDITERKAREQALAQQRDELAHLKRLNTLVRQLTQALQATGTRDAIETAVCEQLTESDLYQAVWIGARAETPTGEPTVLSQAAAGVDEAYLDGIPGGEQGPAHRALRTGEVQVVDDIATAAQFPDARRDVALAHGHHALAAVPLTTGETTYGVLVVYAPQDHAISDPEQDVLADLGRNIALAIQRVHSQRSLTAETAVTLDLRIPDTEFVFGEVSAQLDCELVLDRRISASDGTIIYYLTVHDAAPERVCEQLEADPLVAAGTVVRDTDGSRPPLLEIHLEDTPRLPLDVLTDYGASVRTARAVDNDIHFSVELPPGVDVRAVLATLREVAPTITLVRKEHVERPAKTVAAIQEQVKDRLTLKQQAALEAAYARGYYAWPRDSTMEELAETFDVSAPTLHYRLRMAHQTVMTTLLESEQARPEDERAVLE